MHPQVWHDNVKYKCKEMPFHINKQQVRPEQERIVRDYLQKGLLKIANGRWIKPKLCKYWLYVRIL